MHRHLANPALRIGAIDFRVEFHAGALAQRLCAVVQKVPLELGQPGMAKARHQRQHRAHGKLGLVHRSRPLHRAQHVNGALVHMRDDTRQVLRLQRVVLHHLQQRIGCRVRVAAAGVVLEGSFSRGPAAAQPVGQARRIGVARHAGRHALRAGKNIGCSGKSILG